MPARYDGAGGSDSDEALMLRFRQTSDSRAVDELIRRYSHPAFIIALDYLHERTHAEDAVQQSFLRLIRSCRQYRPEAPFAPWFYTVVRNVCRDMIRRAQSRRRYHDRRQREEDGPPFSAARGDDAIDLRNALRLLRVVDRRILTLNICHGFSFAEIGAAIGCSTEAAKKRAQRALRVVREHMFR